MIHHDQAFDVANGYVDCQFTSSDGLSLYYRDYPGDPHAVPVLCLPGLTRNSRDFSDLAADLAPRHRVIAPDLRGRGRSERDTQWQRYELATYLDDIQTLTAAAGIEAPVVIGTSLGGLLAMMMAGKRRMVPRGVILNDVGPEIAPEGLQRIKGYVAGQPAVENWAAAATQCREIHEAALPDFSDSDWECYARRCYREEGSGIVPDFDPAIGKATRNGKPLSNLWKEFEALSRIPTLLLRGEFSDVLSPKTVALMAARKPDLVCVVVANRGHVPQLNEPECLRAIKQFMCQFRPQHPTEVS